MTRALLIAALLLAGCLWPDPAASFLGPSPPPAPRRFVDGHGDQVVCDKSDVRGCWLADGGEL